MPSFIEEEIGRLRQMCIGCGKCSKVCPSHRHGGIDPMEIMIGSEDSLDMCISCGCCSAVCRRTDPMAVIKDLIALKNGIHVSQTFHDTGYIMPRDVPESLPAPPWSEGGIRVVPGCIAACRLPHIVYATAAGLASMGVEASELQGNTCCLRPVQFREMWEFERNRARIDMRDRASGERLVTLCAGCTEEFAKSGISADHIIKLLHENMGSLPKTEHKMKVALEPGCSAMDLADEMREVVSAMGYEVMDNGFGCCGKSTPLAKELMEERQKECAGADVIVVACPMCLMKYDAFPGGMPVVHISELLAMAAGDSTALGYHTIPVPEKVR
ncbi:MAG: (Fe-S)-binding protein [Candidatus Methanomethylophilaceae archaeon]|nr:(Fe-S)-binding protein [Candidatus Methanomethylophilaceae archaeon]